MPRSLGELAWPPALPKNFRHEPRIGGARRLLSAAVGLTSGDFS